MNLGELDIITRFPGWEFFGTLTFRGKVPSETKARALAFSHFFRVGKVCKVAFPSLIWVLRQETGGIGGRLHFHYLLGNTGLPLTMTGSAILKRTWERLGAPRGHSDVKVYDRALNGPGYVCKVLSGEASAGAAGYEVGRFGSVEIPPDLSNSLLRWVAAASGEGRRPVVASPGRVVSLQRARGRECKAGSSAVRGGGLGARPRIVTIGADKHPF